MERFRRLMTSVQTALAQLSPSQKLLVGTVVIILAMTLFLVQLYSSQNEMVPLMPGATAQQQQQALQFLRTSGIEYSDSNGELMVPASRQRMLLAQMAESNALPDDSRVLFDNLIDKQSWTLSQRQNQQLEIIAVQNELAEIISQMSGIKSAKVILNVPEKRGIGQPNISPSASATVFPVRGLDQNTVDSIAHLVAGSRGIDPKNVRVIDGSTNRQFRAREDGMLGATTYLEFVTAVESRKQQQLYEMLSTYIPGVIVTVHAQVDVTRRRTETKSVLPDGKGSATLLSGEQTMTREMRDAATGGEPGPRSNTREDITGLSSGEAGGSKESTSDSQFTTEFGREVKVVEDPRGNPTKINAVVNIPRLYFVEVWKNRQGATPTGAPAAGTAGGTAAAEPSETDLQPIVEAEIGRIRREVELQIDTSVGVETVKGEVQVSMIPFGGAVPGMPAQEASVLGIPSGTLALDGLARTVGLGVVAAIALGMVVLTAMRATKRESLPTAAELVGVPPALEGNTDLIGEAAEADSALQGIELSDDEMRTRKVAEQVNDLVKEKPDEAARLLGRWIAGS